MAMNPSCLLMTSIILPFNPFSMFTEIISMIFIPFFQFLQAIQIIVIIFVIFFKFIHPNLTWFIRVFKIINKMKWLIPIVWIIYKLATGFYLAFQTYDLIFFGDFFLIIVYCRECSGLVVRMRPSPVWNGLWIASSVQERAGGFIARNSFRIAVSRNEFNAEFGIVILSYNASILLLIAQSSFYYKFFTGTDLYVIIIYFVRFVKNYSANPHGKYQLQKTVVIFKKPVFKEYAIVLKINSIKLDIDIDSMDTNDKNRRNKENLYKFFEYFCYKWYFLAIKERYQLSFHILVEDDSYELYIILKRKSILRDTGRLVSFLNADASTIQANIATELDYQLEIVKDEELESVFFKLGIFRTKEQPIKHIKSRFRFQNMLNRGIFSFSGIKSTLIKFDLHTQVNSFPHQRYWINNCMNQFLKSLMDEKIKAHFFFNFQADRINKIEQKELLSSERYSLEDENKNKEIIRNFDYLIDNARLSAGLFVLSSSNQVHDDIVGRAIGIIQNTWEVNTGIEKNIHEFKRALSANKIDSFMYHVPSFILFKFFHFPTIISRHQERLYKFHLESPPDSVMKAGSLNIGKIINASGPSQDFLLGLEDLKRHVLISGTTGSGKSTFIQNLIGQILIHFPEIPILIIELKGEYTWMEKKYPNVKFFEPGKNLGLNLFEPMGNPQIHAERVFDIMKSSFDFSELKDFSPQMEKVLVDVLSLTCSNPDPSKRDFSTFFANAQKYIIENKSRIPFLDSTWIGIENRIRRIASGPLSKIFDNREQHEDFCQIFRTQSIISLGNIINLGGSKDDLYFFSNLILKQLWDINIQNGPSRHINHITIIDDSQYFSKTRQEPGTKSTSYFDDIALLLRGTGEVLVAVSTRPDISADVLSNCGLIVSFQTKFKEDIEKLQSLLHLNESQVSLLEILPEHTCIVKINSYPYPFMIETRKPLSWEYQENNIDKSDSSIKSGNITEDRKRKMKKQYAARKSFGKLWMSDVFAGYDPSIYENIRIFLDKTEEYYRLKEKEWDDLQRAPVSSFDALDEKINKIHEELLMLIKTNASVKFLVESAEKITPRNLNLCKLKSEMSASSILD